MSEQNENQEAAESAGVSSGKKVRAYFVKTVAGPKGTYTAGSTAEIPVDDFAAWEKAGAVSRAK